MRTTAQKQAREEQLDRGRVFSESWPVVRRIQWRLKQLANPGTPRADRLMVWRAISDAALQAWEQEVQQLEALNSVKADPATEVPIVT